MQNAWGDSAACRAVQVCCHWIFHHFIITHYTYTYTGQITSFLHSQVGSYSCLKELLTVGLRAEEEDASGRTPVQMAIQHGKEELFDLFVEHGSRMPGIIVEVTPCQDSFTLVVRYLHWHLSLTHRPPSYLWTVLGSGASMQCNADGDTLHHKALHGKDYTMLQSLEDAGVNMAPNGAGHLPLSNWSGEDSHSVYPAAFSPMQYLLKDDKMDLLKALLKRAR